jgi:hypothetical protein
VGQLGTKKIYRLTEDQAFFCFRWNWDEEIKLRGIRLQSYSPPPPTDLSPKKDRIIEATLRFGRRNQMYSSNTLSIHGLKKKHQFQDSNIDINGDCVHVTIMYVVYSITRRSSDSTVQDVWPAQPLIQGAL